METFIESFSAGVDAVDSFVWGWALIWLLLGTHLFMTIRTGFIQRKIPTAIKLSVSKNTPMLRATFRSLAPLPQRSLQLSVRATSSVLLRAFCAAVQALFSGCGLPASSVSQPSIPKLIYP